MIRCIDVFFYGLFMDVALLQSKGAHPERVRRASVEGFAIRIGNRATLVANRGHTSHGLVMSLPITEIDALYADPTVSMYRPEAVIARLDDGSAVAALCFNLVDAPGPAERNSEYAEKLRGVARTVGLPADYVATIK